MRTAKQIIENIEDRIEILQKDIRERKLEIDDNILDAVESELQDLLSWIKE